jgi:hypothetical protein
MDGQYDNDYYLDLEPDLDGRSFTKTKSARPRTHFFAIIFDVDFSQNFFKRNRTIAELQLLRSANEQKSSGLVPLS